MYMGSSSYNDKLITDVEMNSPHSIKLTNNSTENEYLCAIIK